MYVVADAASWIQDPFFRFSSFLFYVLKKVSHSGRSKNLFIRDDFFHPRAIIKTVTASVGSLGRESTGEHRFGSIRVLLNARLIAEEIPIRF